MEPFEEILNRYKCPKRTEKSLLTIGEIENIVKCRLPNDYKKYVQYYLGFEEHIGQEFVRLWDFDDLIDANKDYEIFDNLPNTLGIGGNGGGEFIAIEWVEEDRHRVVISPMIDLDKENFIEIGTSFTDFLFRLDTGQQ